LAERSVVRHSRSAVVAGGGVAGGFPRWDPERGGSLPHPSRYSLWRAGRLGLRGRPRGWLLVDVTAYQSEHNAA
jgi:hypothetical protein